MDFIVVEPISLTHLNTKAENEGPGDRKISRDGNRLDSSPPVMMLKSYVLQLLCVQKAPKEASVQTP